MKTFAFTQSLVLAADSKRVYIVAYTGAEMRLAGWDQPVVVDLAGMELPAQVPLLADHCRDIENILGQGEAKVVNGQLIVEGNIAAVGEINERILALAKTGFVFQASIGADPQEVVEIVPETAVKANGRVFQAGKNGLLLVTKSKLKEVSILGLGADDQTEVDIAAKAAESSTAASAAATSANTPKQGVNAMGDEVKKDEAKKTEEKEVVAAAPDPVAEIRAKAAAELERIHKVRSVCAGKSPEIEAKAVTEGWTPEKTELEVVRASRPSAPVFIAPAGVNMNAKVLEAAICLRHNIGTDPFLMASYGQDVLNQADKLRRLPLTRIMELACMQAGVAVPLDTRSSDFLKAAFSTTELSGIVGNVANKALAAAFAAPEAIVPQIAAKRTHTNFLSHTVYSLAMTGDLEKVAPDGELKNLKLGEESWTRQVETRGAVLKITRTDLVNDELGAFLDNANRLGRKSFAAREKAMFTILNATGSGSTFFTSARANYISGATTVLSLAGLDQAVQKFRDQTGPDGEPVLITPKLLLVPTALESTAKNLMNTQSVIAVGLASTSTKSTEPNGNIYAGAFKPLTSPYLSNTALSGYSSTAWYLLADPADVAALEVAYLNGLDTPVVEFFGMESDPTTLGVSWRVYFDFGVALADYRAGVKSKGAS